MLRIITVILLRLLLLTISRPSLCQMQEERIMMTHDIDVEDEPWSNVKCPELCRCSLRYFGRFERRLKFIDCSQSNLKTTPIDLPDDVESLNLSQNRLQTLSIVQTLPNLLYIDASNNEIFNQYLSFNLSNLQTLDLSNNRLRSLDNVQLNGLNDLRELNLKNNRLNYLNINSFVGLSKLETLRLSNNDLQSFVNGLWYACRHLYNLHLDGNHLTSLQPRTFEGLDNLLTLDLSNNRLYRLAERSLDGLYKLELLNLHSNYLTSVPVDILRFLSATIKSINLSKNPINKLKTNDFSRLKRLRDLSISNMSRLRLVERHTFNDLPNLLLINLHDNRRLTFLDADAFLNTPNLLHLHMHNNNLTNLNRKIIAVLPKVREISFYGNPLYCDCNVKWFKDFLINKKSMVLFSEAERIVCDGPPEHRLKLFMTLKSADLPTRCAPRVVGVFEEVNHSKMGGAISYHCKAIGVPTPIITWTNSKGDKVKSIDDSPSVPIKPFVINGGSSLVIQADQIKNDRVGQYFCKAENVLGMQTYGPNLNVTAVELVIKTVTSSSVTISWSIVDFYNTRHDVRDDDDDENEDEISATKGQLIQLQYRLESSQKRIIRHKSLSNRFVTFIIPNTKKLYTLQRLKADTPYELCLTPQNGDGETTKCVRFRTQPLDSSRFLQRTANLALGFALFVVTFLFVFLCLLALKLRTRTAGIRCDKLLDTKKQLLSTERSNFYVNFEDDWWDKSLTPYSLLIQEDLLGDKLNKNHQFSFN